MYALAIRKVLAVTPPSVRVAKATDFVVLREQGTREGYFLLLREISFFIEPYINMYKK